VNGFLAGSYAAFADRLDALLFLQAPGFDVVLDWRCQQEADLLGLAPSDLPVDERRRLATFVQYFERVTRRMLSGGLCPTATVKLDRNRAILSVNP
jgi:D-glycerate 3-kinase